MFTTNKLQQFYKIYHRYRHDIAEKCSQPINYNNSIKYTIGIGMI